MQKFSDWLDRTLVLDATFDVDIDRSELRGELVQLAAMTVAWIAALDGEALA